MVHYNLLNNDCLIELQKIESNSIDLVVTSPPYNCNIGYDIYIDKIDWKLYYKWCKEWLQELYRVIKLDGRVCIVHYLSMGDSNSRQAPLMIINNISENIGFKHHGLAIWWDTQLSKLSAWGSWLSSSSPYINSPFEGILILYKDQWKRNSKGKTNISKREFMESCSGIWKIPTEKNRTHPAPFPEALSDRCIKLLSYENDIVLDPFMGSGTVGVSCIKYNRNFIGIELSENYFKMAKNRIENTQNTNLTNFCEVVYDTEFI